MELPDLEQRLRERHDRRLNKAAHIVYAGLGHRFGWPAYDEWRKRVLMGIAVDDHRAMVLTKDEHDQRVLWVQYVSPAMAIRPALLRGFLNVAQIAGYKWVAARTDESDRPEASGKILSRLGFMRVAEHIYAIGLQQQSDAERLSDSDRAISEPASDDWRDIWSNAGISRTAVDCGDRDSKASRACSYMHGISRTAVDCGDRDSNASKACSYMHGKTQG